MKIKITLLLCLLFCATFFVGCATQQEEKVLTLGVVQPLSGDASVYGDPVKRVIEKAVADVNAAWSKKQMRLQVIYEDGKCSAKDALSSIQKLSSLHDVKVVYGSACSGATLGMSHFAEQQGIVVLSSLASSPEITHAGDYIFRNYPSDTAQVAKVVPFVVQKRFKRVALLSENTDFAQAQRQGYKNLFALENIAVVADEVVEQDGKDVRAQITKIKESSPDVVIILPQTVPMVGTMTKELTQLNVGVAVIGNDIVSFGEALEKFSEQMEGIYAPSLVFEKEQDSAFLSFAQLVDCQLGIYCATTYDGIILLSELLERCGDKDSSCIKQGLYATQGWQGTFADPFSFDKNGDVAGVFKISQVVDGKYVAIE